MPSLPAPQPVEPSLARYEAEAVGIKRADWIKDARASFSPGQRQPCAVCGKYRSLTHAHHIVPLACQTGAHPNHEYVWLCPTHHAAVHLLIAQALSSRDRAGRWQIEMICEMEAAEFEKILALFRRFGEAA